MGGLQLTVSSWCTFIIARRPLDTARSVSPQNCCVAPTDRQTDRPSNAVQNRLSLRDLSNTNDVVFTMTDTNVVYDRLLPLRRHTHLKSAGLLLRFYMPHWSTACLVVGDNHRPDYLVHFCLKLPKLDVLQALPHKNTWQNAARIMQHKMRVP